MTEPGWGNRNPRPRRPLHVGQPPRDVTYETAWGNVRAGGPCRDDYVNLAVYVQQKTGRYVKLQAPALRSFREAEEAIGSKILCTGTIRSCSTQEALYRQDPQRYAPPDKGAHTRGLAIDVSMGQTKAKRAAIHAALTDRGWFQSRPDDEPWHYSFGIVT